MSIRIIKGGTLTTLQDLGRKGWQSFGISIGGAMDQYAARLVNIVLGNKEDEAVLEMTLNGPTLQFYENTIIALYGADMKPRLNGSLIEMGKPVQVRVKDVLKFEFARLGMRTYLGVKGGFDIQSVLGSKSTNLKAGFGGFQGRALQKGDILPIKKSLFLGLGDPTWRLPFPFYRKKPSFIRFVRGRQYDWFSPKSQQLFHSSTFTISSQSDRMGFRLTGPAIMTEHPRELTTEATTFGSIQIPGDGQPIILMADRQPTGGYPKIGEVITPDLSILSQMRPGEKIHFAEISLREAQSIYIEQQRQLTQLKAACQLKWSNLQ